MNRKDFAKDIYEFLLVLLGFFVANNKIDFKIREIRADWNDDAIDSILAKIITNHHHPLNQRSFLIILFQFIKHLVHFLNQRI
jgi:hypothetical protein